MSVFDNALKLAPDVHQSLEDRINEATHERKALEALYKGVERLIFGAYLPSSQNSLVQSEIDYFKDDVEGALSDNISPSIEVLKAEVEELQSALDQEYI